MNQAEKSERTREAICLAARQLFAEKGYDTTTMQDIVRASGMSKGAIYHHFSSKQEVLRSVIEGEWRYLNEFVEDLAAQSDASVTDRMTVLATHMVASSPQSGLGRANWVSEVPEALLESLRHSLTKLAPHLEQMLRQGMESGEIGCTFPHEVAEVGPPRRCVGRSADRCGYVSANVSKGGLHRCVPRAFQCAGTQ